MRHTPGPWVAEQNSAYWHIRAESTHERIGDTCSSIYLYAGDNGEANAYLMAAAPDLLAALKRLMPHAGSRTSLDREVLNDLDDALADAREAIAKAEGGQS